MHFLKLLIICLPILPVLENQNKRYLMKITLCTYRIIPYLKAGEPREPYYKPGSEWVRDAVKGLMHRYSTMLKKQAVDTSLFHNHDEQNSHNKPGYPLIIYHFTGGEFLVTGINEGAYALGQLMALYDEPVNVSQQLMVDFAIYKEIIQDIKIADKPIAYNLHRYLALNSTVHKEFETAGAMRKIIMLEEAIIKHIDKDLFKYLTIDLPAPQVFLLDLPLIEPVRQTYKNHQYLSFNLKFSANLVLPDYLALGNGKAFGYGIIENHDRKS